jgi:hypothetical protein
LQVWVAGQSLSSTHGAPLPLHSRPLVQLRPLPVSAAVMGPSASTPLVALQLVTSVTELGIPGSTIGSGIEFRPPPQYSEPQSRSSGRPLPEISSHVLEAPQSESTAQGAAGSFEQRKFRKMPHLLLPSNEKVTDCGSSAVQQSSGVPSGVPNPQMLAVVVYTVSTTSL